MKLIKWINNNHLQNIALNSSVVSTQVMEQLESSFPLLIAYLSYLRQINGIQHKIDVLNQNAQMLKEFNYLCEHNLLFFLTVTGQFNIIRDLFQDKGELARLIALLEDIENEHNNALINQKDPLLPLKLIQAKAQESQKAPIDPAVYGLSPMMMYKYYEEELQRLTVTYHFKQSKLYYEAANDVLADIDQAIGSVRANKSMDSTVKARSLMELEALKKGVSKEKEIYEKVGTRFSRLKSQNSQEAESLHLAGKNYFDKISTLLEKHQNLSPEIKNIYHRNEERIIHTTAKAKQNEQEFLQEKEEIKPHLEHSREILIESVDENLSQIIRRLENILSLDADNEVKLAAPIQRLKTLHKQIKTADSYSKINELLEKCNSELVSTKQIIAHVGLKSVQKDFDNDFTAFQKIITTSQSRQDGVEPVAPSSLYKENNFNSPILEEKKKGVLDFDSPQHQIIEPPEPEYKLGLQPQVPAIEDKIVQQAIQERNLGNSSLSNKEENYGKISNFELREAKDTIKFYKHTYADIKNQASSDGVKEVDPVNQSKYQSSIEIMLDCMDELKFKCSDADELIKVERLETLLNKAVSLGYSQVNEPEIQEIRALAVDLEEHHEALRAPREELEMLFDFLQKPAQNIM